MWAGDVPSALCFPPFGRSYEGAADVGWTDPLALGSTAVSPLRGNRTLLVGCGAPALYMASVAGAEFYLVTLLLQEGLGFEPPAAGIAFLPPAVCITLGNMIAGRLLDFLGCTAHGAAGLRHRSGRLVMPAVSVHNHSYLVGMLPGLMVSGIGQGVIRTSVFDGGTRDVDNHNRNDRSWSVSRSDSSSSGRLHGRLRREGVTRLARGCRRPHLRSLCAAVRPPTP
ncbi:hypothetical protein OIE73_36685 [Streptomyces hirsutus]|uniref:Uncharacterized protein n=1 Tax=Streptomyces hirsutus TaxID=35620 RepID=A0ABZ1GWV3_9ACTN|nr:hypothetical protein [Streptomyces hirsutus]WSD10696.1 hypothetical protein OIE73_36685 [Streptomyces hirsutus]